MKLTSLLVTGAMVISLVPTINVSAYAGGDGTEGNPYLISSRSDWEEFRNYIKTDADQGAGEYWKLTADIDFTITDGDQAGNKDWVTPIGNCDRDGVGDAFKGHFDGDGYVIKNYVINCDGNLKVQGAYGLFSGIGENAVIENLGIEDASIRMGVDYHWVSSGAMVGVVTGNAQITNCYVKNITDERVYQDGHYSYRGGMAGRMIDNASVTNCYSIGYSFTQEPDSVNGAGIVGGITSTNTTVTNCYSDTTIAIADAGAWGNNWYNIYYLDTTTLPWPHEYWHGTNSPKGYIGEKQTYEQLKAVPNNIKPVFAVDKQNINNGYPILKYQVAPNVLNGTGTESDPYLINDADDLLTLGEMKDTADKYFMLTADIDLNNEIWTPMATESNPFKGDLDGNGHIIKNYKIDLINDGSSYGLFAYIGAEACIHNLGIENVTAMLHQWHWNEIFGGLVGTVTGNANVRECYVKKVRHELQWNPWPLISSNPNGQGQFHTSGGLIGLLDGANVEVTRCYALDVEEDYKLGSGEYEGAKYEYSMFDSGLIGRGETFRCVSDCYSDTFVIQNRLGTRVDNSYQTLNNTEWYDGYTWGAWLSDVRYISWKWSGAFAPGNMSLSGYAQFPSLKWENAGGKYLNYVKEGRMTKENAPSIFAAANAVREFVWETNRVSVVMKLPKESSISYDVNLTADKYYKVSFKAKTVNQNGQSNMEFKLGNTDLTDLLQIKTIGDDWEATAVYVKPATSGSVKLVIGGSEDMLVDDVEVVEVDADIETEMLGHGFDFYNKSQALASDLYKQKKICDGVEVQYYANYIAPDGTLQDVPVGLGNVEDQIDVVMQVADRMVTREIPITIKKTEPIDIVSIVMTDENGKRVYNIENAAKIDKIQTKINQTANNVKLYAALYNDSVLKSVKLYDVAEEINANLAVNGADGIKLFALTDKIVPLACKEQTLPTLADDAKVTIHTIGDSLCATYTEDSELRGWGQMIGDKFNPNNVTVDNTLARGGMTAEEFVSSGRLDQLIDKLQSGDYVFIQLATNDFSKFTKAEFKNLLLQFVVASREKGAIPVFVTAPERLSCATDELDENGKYITNESLHGYPDVMREIGMERDVPVVDLNAAMVKLMSEIGLSGMKKLDYYVDDELHFNKAGAGYLVDTIASGVDELKLPIAKFVITQ